MKNRNQMKLHFVGIGGIGMSGIAEVFLNQGYQVSGSDKTLSDITQRLEKLGAKIFKSHAAENVIGASCVVISSAIRSDNPECVEARKRHIPVIPRAEMLGELMRDKVGIAVAGSHGKTTTTSMLATILHSSDLDPTVVVGGKVDRFGGNAKLGQGRYVVAEADESDGSFLHLPATYAVITNIDNDHLDHFGNLRAIEDAFVALVAKLPFYGFAAVCAEDPGVQRCMSRFIKPVVTYGINESADFQAKNVDFKESGSTFEVYHQGTFLGSVEVFVPGRHNVLNALAAISVAVGLGVKWHNIAQGISEYQGVKRRFEIKYKSADRNRVIIDDYGHHPTEVAATLEAAKKFWPKGRVIVAFQPHRYSRTLHCRDGFLSAFQKADLLYLTEIYSAGEEPIEGVSGEKLCEWIQAVSAIPSSRVFVKTLDELKVKLLN